MSDEYLDIIHRETRKIMNTGFRLQYLSESFYQTGNHIMGDKFSAMGAMLLESQKAIYSAVARDINRQIKLSGEHSVTVLNASLAGAKLAIESIE